MIWLAAILGGLIGIAIRYLYQHIMHQIKQELYQSYHWLLTEKIDCIAPDHWLAQQQAKQKRGGIFSYFFSFDLHPKS